MKYNIIGEPLPVVICDMDPGEVMITESGAMSWMSPNMKMETTTAAASAKPSAECFPGILFFRIAIPHRAVLDRLPLLPVSRAPSKQWKLLREKN